MFPEWFLGLVNNEYPPCDAHGFNQCMSDLYAMETIEEFNARIESHATALFIRFRFNPRSDSNWVSVYEWYRFGIGKFVHGGGDRERPLCSWSFREKMAYIPPEKDLLCEVVWRRYLSTFKNMYKLKPLTLDELHIQYVADACRQMKRLERNLGKWKRIGHPTHQDECTFNKKRERQILQYALRLQQCNVMDFKEKFRVFWSTDAPEFILERIRQRIQHEEKIAAQIGAAMVAAKVL